MTDPSGDGAGDRGGGSSQSVAEGELTIQLRGIYATALTAHLLDDGWRVLNASDEIDARFDGSFGRGEPDVRVEMGPARLGVSIVGTPAGVMAAGESIAGLGRDAFCWRDEAPLGSIHDGIVTGTTGGGAIVDLGNGVRDVEVEEENGGVDDDPVEGYLPFGAVDRYVEIGDRVRVQVVEPSPPWSRQRPTLDGSIRVPGALVSLLADEETSVVEAPDRETAGLVGLLETDVPSAWGSAWTALATGASLATLEEALERVNELAAAVESAVDVSSARPPPDAEPGRLVTPLAGRWCLFGGEARGRLDRRRGEVLATLPGHHRIKAIDDVASVAVDFAEAVCPSIRSDEPAGTGYRDGRSRQADDTSNPGPAGDEGGRTDADRRSTDGPGMNFAAVTDRFGPAVGDAIAIEHGKPTGDWVRLGRGTVEDLEPGGTVTVRRTMGAGGTYDGLGVAKEAGDEAVTTLAEGRWWYPTVYRDDEGDHKGTYVNVCTPIEVFPTAVRYVDLYVDVVKHADGRVERLDDDELEDAIDRGAVEPELGRRARTVASSIERALREDA